MGAAHFGVLGARFFFTSDGMYTTTDTCDLVLFLRVRNVPWMATDLFEDGGSMAMMVGLPGLTIVFNN